MKLTGGSSITLGGAVVIYITGNCDLSGGAVLNTGEIAANLQLEVMGNSVQLSGGSDTYAVVYAPSADIQDSGQAGFFGMMVGQSIEISGGAGLHYDESLNGLVSGGAAAQLVK